MLRDFAENKIKNATNKFPRTKYEESASTVIMAISVGTFYNQCSDTNTFDKEIWVLNDNMCRQCLNAPMPNIPHNVPTSADCAM